MATKTSPRKHAPRASHGPSDTGSAPQWAMEDLAAAWMGIPWMKLWMQAWTAWAEQWGVNAAALQGSGASAEDRRQAGLTWLPQLETTVIPLRRRDDHPGTEASKVSLRVRVPALPWTAGTTNIIAIDTLMPRLVETPDEAPPITH
ncbi:hypothetical protein [Aromatoleum diolicum]|uniref:Uncharacterized protein n=1 Tax=Aromatoleum diolicum TaxID=75796 RepID=A0ABX1Q9V9_9RHOO|nr:hypothetical protein [Aromatoleum diolicum]NMG75171.1 hypothetical protein [Aromatoleum diolicum]